MPNAINPLKEIRKRHNLGQFEMACILNVSAGYYRQVESGWANLSPRRLPFVADFFKDVELEKLKKKMELYHAAIDAQRRRTVNKLSQTIGTQ